MRFVKNALMALGALLVLVMAAIGYLAVDGRTAKASGEKFAARFLSDFSSSWDVGAVEDRLTQDILDQLQGDRGATALREFSKLGRFGRFENLSLVQYAITGSGKFTVLDFTGTFENGRANGRVNIVTSAGAHKVKVLAIRADGPLKRATTL